MPESKKQTGLWLIALASAIVLAGVVVWVVVKPKSAKQTEHYQHEHHSLEFAKDQKISLDDIIRTAKNWTPAHKPWYSEIAPDFTLIDIDGKQHRLSDYRGKDTLIIFWATWCVPCLMEIPHLIELRKTIGEDKLAMLAVSNENPVLVRKFVAREKINYTVLLDTGILPSPFNRVRYIPCSFFIDSDGKIKLATTGVLSLDTIKAILRAE